MAKENIEYQLSLIHISVTEVCMAHSLVWAFNELPHLRHLYCVEPLSLIHIYLFHDNHVPVAVLERLAVFQSQGRSQLDGLRVSCLRKFLVRQFHPYLVDVETDVRFVLDGKEMCIRDRDNAVPSAQRICPGRTAVSGTSIWASQAAHNTAATTIAIQMCIRDSVEGALIW